MNQLLNGERNRHADVMGLILVVNKQSLMPFKLLIISPKDEKYKNIDGVNRYWRKADILPTS